MRNPLKPKRSEPDYEKLGRLMYDIAQSEYSNQVKLYKVAFWKGVITGLGGVSGATIVVTLLLLLFTALGRIPLVGPLILNLKEILSQPAAR